jgi:hypothetical protein
MTSPHRRIEVTVMDDVTHVRSIAHSWFEREIAEDISQRMLEKSIITCSDIAFS